MHVYVVPVALLATKSSVFFIVRYLTDLDKFTQTLRSSAKHV